MHVRLRCAQQRAVLPLGSIVRTAHAVLLSVGALAGIGVARLVVGHQDLHRQLVLEAANMHQRLMQDGVNHPERYAEHPTLGLLPEQERSAALHMNRLIALLCAKYQARVMTDDELLDNLAALTHDPSARAYWQRAGARWTSETAVSAPRVRQFGMFLANTFDRAAVRP
ncbi:DUF6082 family protein [Kitasatospora sp. NPDC058444]|uniref:DUF6082 family protein n=1 Tax=Kitasatospora sp. NPDC058444 TaxID=3346504 RepID=UPI00365B19E0